MDMEAFDEAVQCIGILQWNPVCAALTVGILAALVKEI
jgi:hypothetical protein